MARQYAAMNYGMEACACMIVTSSETALQISSGVRFCAQTASGVIFIREPLLSELENPWAASRGAFALGFFVLIVLRAFFVVIPMSNGNC